MLSEEEKQLVFDLVIRPDGAAKLSTDEFAKKFPYDVSTIKISLLEGAKVARDADEVECGLILCFRFGCPENAWGVLCELMKEEWHYAHENIALLLDDLKNPETVDCLYETTLMRFPYLDFDDTYALAAKCIWALGNIGNQAAKEKLTLLSESSNEITRKRAIDQLARISGR